MDTAIVVKWLVRLGLALFVIAAAAWSIRQLTGKPGANNVRFRDALVQSLKDRSKIYILILAAGLVFATLIPLADMRPMVSAAIATALDVFWIAMTAWGATILLAVLSDLTQWKYDISVAHNLSARQVQTKVKVLRRILIVVIWLAALAGVLMLSDRFRALGGTLLASAGVAGIVIGLSAQKTFGAIIAGIQVALSQPINIDDVVVLEGEWGRIEEITFTYVVVKTWDLRRLIVPISYFLEKPFQNWTRTNADILGSVFIHADYSVPMDGLRQELRRLCQSAGDLWDGKVCVLQVTEAGPETVTLRALISASDASKAWDLRCLVREGLIRFLQDNHPECLPKRRVRLEDGEAPLSDGGQPSARVG